MSSTIKCFTKGCNNRITEPHEWNNYDMWCAKCHAKSRNKDKPESFLARRSRLNSAFALRCARDGHKQRGNY